MILLTGHGETAVMELNNGAADCQAHACSRFAPALGAGTVETIEDQFLLGRVDADSAIGNADQNITAPVLSRNKDDFGFEYFSLQPGMHRAFGTHFDSFWCCTRTGIEEYSKTNDSIYSHHHPGTTDTNLANALYVNQFIGSELQSGRIHILGISCADNLRSAPDCCGSNDKQMPIPTMFRLVNALVGLAIQRGSRRQRSDVASKRNQQRHCACLSR